MAAGPAGGGAASGTGWRGLVAPLLLPSWLVIGIFLLLPVMLMAVYSFLTASGLARVRYRFQISGVTGHASDWVQPGCPSAHGIAADGAAPQSTPNRPPGR
jgi:ABC-type sugar transport system permease subunit